MSSAVLAFVLALQFSQAQTGELRLAVVDAADRLVGAVTVDDLLDHLLPRHWRDRDQNEPTARQHG